MTEQEKLVPTAPGDIFFFLTNSPHYKDIHLTVIQNRERQKILTFFNQLLVSKFALVFVNENSF